MLSCYLTNIYVILEGKLTEMEKAAEIHSTISKVIQVYLDRKTINAEKNTDCFETPLSSHTCIFPKTAIPLLETFFFFALQHITKGKM